MLHIVAILSLSCSFVGLAIRQRHERKSGEFAAARLNLFGLAGIGLLLIGLLLRHYSRDAQDVLAVTGAATLLTWCVLLKRSLRGNSG